MNAFYDDGQVTMYQGDVREVLRELPAESVQMAVCSPPYWSLRDYGVEPTIWGGDEYHLHEWGDTIEQQRGGAYTGKTRWQHIAAEANEEGVPVRTIDPEAWGLIDGHPGVASGQFCAGCGAWRGALGLEPTPELFIAHTVEVFREVRRVLRPDATCWINIGDSYAANQNGGGSVFDAGRTDGRKSYEADKARGRETKLAKVPPGLKPKDLVGIPWMLAFALRADGWWLRQDIIWHKLNPMPESVRDRCTKAHEYLFLLSKSPRYHYDAKAIDEPASPNTNPRTSKAKMVEIATLRANGANTTLVGIEVSPKSAEAGSGIKANESYHHAMALTVEERNKRSVWSIPTEPYPDAHFATYPTALVEPCILAGCPEGGVVLDPFLGSGTTALVARRLGRRCIGIDLNPEYLSMAVRRAGGQLSLELSEATS